MTRADVILWGRRIGAALWDDSRDIGAFEYVPEFTRSGIEPAPLAMPLRPGVFEFPDLPRAAFKGLPGLLADSLPDKFGHLLINRWLAEQGRAPGSFNPVERLCYTGRRGMGALEFEPSTRAGPTSEGGTVDISGLVELADHIVKDRLELKGRLAGDDDQLVLEDILRVGTSAGGARAKAVLAWKPATGEFRSGQLDAQAGFEPWLLKFDGVSENADKEIADPLGYGRLEYACHLLAREAGITMSDCRLHEEGGRAHFMTRRFDRTKTGGKLHMQTLAAMRHFDFNQPRAYSYEQAIETIRMLGLGHQTREEMVRRALLNIVIRNQDDHVKNIAFLMDRAGQWSLAPAYDVVYAYNPSGDWTSQHQMSLSGKTDGFELDDLLRFGRFGDIKPARLKAMLDDILAAARNWPRHVAAAEVPERLARTAHSFFRMDWN
ncbi:type II toxin-antitoxin system HipA family toxin [Maricaulis maris]|uniref:Serine/threonine-protein kinase HipA n=1 Tax=Maricaulis maris TaxID=74318 RepID=A0A495DDP1_9PROT|nr:type II toxin-antitoxin system HipA family toxin [Maricaulis maris]RKR00432.1 serine/threonine-protein kinase HipA [Maricaulis maris]